MLNAAFKQFARGFFMGCADIVPGVSGGTVALILGIYRAFIDNIRGGARALKRLVTGDLRGGFDAIKAIDWWFIIPLGGGVLLAFALLRHPMEDLLVERPEGVAAVFFGLVMASCWLVWRDLRRDVATLAVLAVVAVLAFWLLGYQNGVVASPSLVAFFLTGSIAICAMVLPGISGSFIMLMLGMYAAVLGGELIELAVFFVGAVIGLALFSSLLNWLLEHYEPYVMASLLGLMVGSARVLWPWPNGVGVISDETDQVVRGTDLAWPAATDLLGGTVLAMLAVGATLAIVHFAEATSDELPESVGVN